MDNSAETIGRDIKIIVLSVFGLVGGGGVLVLFVATYPKWAFYGTVLVCLAGVLILALSR